MILVTGGGGYIGAVTVPALVRAGYRVRVLDKFLFGKEVLAEVADRIEIVEADIRAVDASVFQGVSAVLHLAGLSNDPMAEYNPEANQQINAGGTRHLAGLAKEQRVRRFIFASSCAIYDRGTLGSTDELTEDAPVAPKAAYARSKLAAEQSLLELADESFCPVILRQGTVYGWSPRMRYDLVVNTFVKTAWQKRVLTLHAGGVMWRPLVDVADVAECYLHCLETDLQRVGGEIFNLSFKNYQIRELACDVKEALADVGDVEIVIDTTPQFVRDYRVSTAKIEHVVGFRPARTVQNAVHDMIDRIRAGITADVDHPRYYNIRWMELLASVETIIRRTGGVF